MRKKYAAGADIGGSHISCALVDLERQDIVKESFVSHKVDNTAGADEILGIWADALEKTICCKGKDQLAGIGFAMPGPFDYEQGIALFTKAVVKYGNLNNIHVADRLREKMGMDGGFHFRFINDATSFAICEAWVGKARSCKRSLSVTLGTGFGSAFIDSGIPVVEGPDVPPQGCVWHLPYRDGIADDYFSTRWFIKRYLEMGGKTLHGAEELASLAREDQVACTIFEDFGKNLGDFLGLHLRNFRSEMLVLGGNISEAFNLFGKNLVDSLKRQNLHVQTAVSGLKEDAAITGSARLLDDTYWEKVKPLLKKM